MQYLAMSVQGRLRVNKMLEIGPGMLQYLTKAEVLE